MSDYELHRLNPTDFEHLVQALAVREIAAGVIPFGAGPDGGREATFRGKMQYPSAGDPWDGYLVVQAKFRQRPLGSDQDGAWALRELREEFDKFLDPLRKLPKPEYYIFVTNAVLTPVHGSGSKDKAFELCESYRLPLGLKGFDIWDFDKLCRLLDANAEIRNSYRAFVTPGDALATIIKSLERASSIGPDFDQVMFRFLQAELRGDRHARLREAGFEGDQQTPLAQVFVDLRAFDAPTNRPPPDESDGSLPSGAIAELVGEGGRVLRPSSRVREGEGTDVVAGRYVVVGGPGQGKSTFGQLLCQLHRAAILEPRRGRLAAEARAAYNEIAKLRSEFGVEPTRRFPVRIPLPELADQLAHGRVTTVLQFLQRRIQRAADTENIGLDDLRVWLGAYPWLVVLDGLDEVPPSGSRVAVLEAVEGFWGEVAAVEADVLVVATTRPQGYGHEFSPDLYRHRYLAPLSPARALRYAERLIVARHPVNHERRGTLLSRFHEAANTPSVARLMETPLQVTFLAALIESGGPLPKERWRLFRGYYDVVYRRERDKPEPVSKVLRELPNYVDAVHRRAGLLLQLASASPGDAEARLERARFTSVVTELLLEEGFGGDDLERRTEQIVESALTRLVLLVGSEDERVHFEVRSIQEFMAAEALMDGPDTLVQERLRSIAPVPFWRNVFLFAAGKCFADRLHLRDTIHTICAELQDSAVDKLGAAVMSGARLALDLLDDDVAREQPGRQRRFVSTALELLDIAEPWETERLADVYTDAFADLYRGALAARLGTRGIDAQRSGWALAHALTVRDVDWIAELANPSWPDNPEDAWQLLQVFFDPVSTWSAGKTYDALRQGSEPWWKIHELDIDPPIDPESGPPQPVQVPEWYLAASSIVDRAHRIRSVLIYAGEPPEAGRLFGEIVSIRVPVRGLGEDKVSLPSDHPDWMVLEAARYFSSDPSASRLADALRQLSSGWDPAGRAIGSFTAWPLAACLYSARSQEDLNRLAADASIGCFGDTDTWIEAERRWVERGITEEDWMAADLGHEPFSASISERGYPFAIASMTAPGRRGSRLFEELRRRINSLGSDAIKKPLARHLLTQLRQMYKLRGVEPVHAIKPAELLNWINLAQRMVVPLEAIQFFEDPMSEDAVAVLDALGRGESVFRPIEDRWGLSERLATAFVEDTSRVGLLRVLAGFALQSPPVLIPLNLLQADLYDDPQIREAALILSIVHPDCRDADKLAAQVADLGQQRHNVVAAADARNPPNGFRELLLTRLMDLHRQGTHFSVNAVLERLEQLNAGREAGLAHAEIWERLGLPGRH